MKNLKIAVVGLGYVGLPLALAFGKKYVTIGFDISSQKIESFLKGCDPTGEVSGEDFSESSHMEFSANPEVLGQADFIIVAVPTPIDEARIPNMTPLKEATKTVASHMKKGATVIYESTVYPGTTEEICIPLLEKLSGFKWKEDFHIGYSPERINPGDKLHRLETVVKVVAGDTEETLEKISELYSSIIEAGIHPVSSIKVAEAAKVIENTQRDLNIALMNELAMIFDRLNIDSMEVLEAAGTKWNFLPFRPGLVGGHCIGVDPYYLTHKAQMVGYHPEVILAGRRVNDNMGKFIAEQTIKYLLTNGKPIKDVRVAVLGLTFKENCRDLRNTRVIDIILELQSYGVDVMVYDPIANVDEAKNVLGIELLPWEAVHSLDALILAVPHKVFSELTSKEIAEKINSGGVVVDIKSILSPLELAKLGLKVWRL